MTIQPEESWWDWQARKREQAQQYARQAGRTNEEITEIEARSEGSVPYCLICGEEEEDEGNCVCSAPDLANWTAADIVIAARAGRIRVSRAEEADLLLRSCRETDGNDYTKGNP